MKKKVIICALVGSMTASAIPMTAQASSYSVSELQVNIWDNNQLAGLQQIADEWTEIYGVKVTINVVEWDSYWTLLEAGASGGNHAGCVLDAFQYRSDVYGERYASESGRLHRCG
ncbi:MAG: hypothetical protein LUG62_03070 [Clostridiales bacterium]|nr:hypothetical protein [Clostridiales bacterium]